MPDEELVNAYVEGHLSRRAFVRSLLAAGVGLTAALHYADVFAASPTSTPQGKPDTDDDPRQHGHRHRDDDDDDDDEDEHRGHSHTRR
jgi:hypothetical protein